MDEFGPVGGEGGHQPTARKRHPDLGVAGQGQGGDAHHGAGRVRFEDVGGAGSARVRGRGSLRPRGVAVGGWPPRSAGGPGRGRRAGRGRGYDERFVATRGKVPGGLHGAVGHAVDIGREGFGDDDDTHTRVVVAPDVTGPTWIFPPGERPVSVRRPVARCAALPRSAAPLCACLGSDSRGVGSDPAAYRGLYLGLLGRVGGQSAQPFGDPDVAGLRVECGDLPGGLLTVPQAFDGEAGRE